MVARERLAGGVDVGGGIDGVLGEIRAQPVQRHHRPQLVVRPVAPDVRQHLPAVHRLSE